MTRSSDVRNIFRAPDPRDRPFLIGRLPSREGGLLQDVTIAFDADGNPVTSAVEQGLYHERVTKMCAYLEILGCTASMTPRDISESLDEQQDKRERKMAKDPTPVISQAEMKKRVGDLIEKIKGASVARRQF